MLLKISQESLRIHNVFKEFRRIHQILKEFSRVPKDG